MFYHVLLTNNCNMCCSYCGEKAFKYSAGSSAKFAIDESLPPELSYDLEELYKFLRSDKDATVTFYGGEPTLRLDLIREIMDNAPAKRFMMQTNGLLLDRLEKKYTNRFHTILVSIDGARELTDFYRGKDTYAKVMQNIRYVLANGYKDELIARMTVAERTDIFKAVKHLAENSNYSFSSIHWQMDANFWSDFRKRNFRQWAEKSYNPGIKKLAAWWVSKMRSEGKVLKLYPFLDTAEDLLLGSSSMLRCGSGYANYSIMTDGNIAPCPIMAGMKDYYVGHISKSNPLKLKRILVSKPCTSCGIYGFCGGRCLYSSITKPWPRKGRKIVCGTVKNLFEAINSSLPEIKKLIAEGRIQLKDFGHIKFNGCEIIP